MSPKVKAGLNFGITMAIIYIASGLLLNRGDESSRPLLAIIATGLVIGVVSGFLFAWLMTMFTSSKMVAESTRIQVEPGEEILFQTGANHFKGIEGVGGKLYLTNKRLIFKSHKLNIQSHELSINLSDIESVEKYRTLGVINNGLSIKAQSQTEKFVVEKADEWVRQLGK